MSSLEEDLCALGKSIKRQRNRAGYTQEKLAELCDFDPTYISLLERGKRNPPFSTIRTIAKVLEVDMKGFF